jgi:hypothetical protein
VLRSQLRNSHGTFNTSCRLAGVQNRTFRVADTSTERKLYRAVMVWLEKTARCIEGLAVSNDTMY